MVRKCLVCKSESPKEPLHDPQTTHGICTETCEELYYQWQVQSERLTLEEFVKQRVP